MALLSAFSPFDEPLTLEADGENGLEVLWQQLQQIESQTSVRCCRGARRPHALLPPADTRPPTPFAAGTAWHQTERMDAARRRAGAEHFEP